MSRDAVAILALSVPPVAGLLAWFMWWTPVFGATFAAGVAWGLSLCAAMAVGVVQAHWLLDQED